MCRSIQVRLAIDCEFDRAISASRWRSAEGHSNVDESMVTGEPLAISKKTGDFSLEVSINQQAVFILRLDKVGRDTNAVPDRPDGCQCDSESRAPIQEWLTKWRVGSSRWSLLVSVMHSEVFGLSFGSNALWPWPDCRPWSVLIICLFPVHWSGGRLCQSWSVSRVAAQIGVLIRDAEGVGADGGKSRHSGRG